MATYTSNLNLKKPAGSDYVLVSDFNTNSDTLDSVIGKPSQLETVERTNLVLAINEAMKRGGENAPYIDNVTKTWWMWDIATWQYIDTGYPATGPGAGFDMPTAQATILPEGAEPTASVSASGPDTAKLFAFSFGIPKGDKGDAAGVGTPTATAETLLPNQDATVEVSATGPDTAKVFGFQFGIPKGDTGENAEIVDVTASVDNTSGNPQVVATMGGTPQARTFDFAFTGLRGVDGAGAVSSVNNVPPDGSGNVSITAADTGAIPQPDAGSVGQVLTKTTDGVAWLDASGTVQRVDGVAADGDGNVQLNAVTYTAQSLTDAEALNARRNLGAGSNANLLDNWDFRNPVNQRGQTEYTGLVYTVDRWMHGHTAAQKTNILATGINVGFQNTAVEVANALFQQILPATGLAGKTVTVSADIAAVNTADCCIYVGFFDKDKTMVSPTVRSETISRTGISAYTVDVPQGTELLYIILQGASRAAGDDINAYTVFSRAKLELGSVSTLENDPPMDYTAELQKCAYYYRVLPLCNPIGIGANTEQLRTTLTFEGSPMRIPPTATVTTASAVIAGSWVQPDSTPIVTSSSKHVTFGYNYTAGTITTNTTYLLQLAVALSADL